MLDNCEIPTRGRSTTKKPLTKKALLIGIGYDSGIGRDGQQLDHIPTSIPNVRAFAEFLRGERSFSFLIFSHLHNTLCLPEFRGYTDITVMTDEDGVEERYQPTKSNLVRHFLQPRPKPTDPNNSFF